MIVQNNSTPWIVLVLLIMLGCVVAGMMLGSIGPFNTETDAAKEQMIQTQGSISTRVAADNLDLRNQLQDGSTGFAGFVIIGIAILVIGAWIVTRLFVQITIARAQEKAAHAQLLAEQRRLASLWANRKTQKSRRIPLPPLRTSWILDPRDEEDSPKRNE